MRILCLQHASVEHAGSLRSLVAQDGHELVAVELDEGEALPSLDGFDALWVMGGPMDVWEEDLHPWLIGEKALIREAVLGRSLPFLGLCLGHQLLGEALGGKVGLAKTPEIGVSSVDLTAAGQTSGFFYGVPDRFEVLQWHSAEILELPDGAVPLAHSQACRHQAISYGNHAFSAQFHVEIEPETVKNWAGISAYKEALEKAMGDGAVARLDQECAMKMKQFNEMAARLYANWVSRITP